MTDEIFNTLKEFVIKQSAVDDEEITKETQIEDELGMTGDDAVEFMIAYGKTFNVDVTKFMAADYFGPEVGILFRLFKRSRKILTVGHLEKGILAGRLDEEIINS
jgi:acyl carrier protein